MKAKQKSAAKKPATKRMTNAKSKRQAQSTSRATAKTASGKVSVKTPKKQGTTATKSAAKPKAASVVMVKAPRKTAVAQGKVAAKKATRAKASAVAPARRKAKAKVKTAAVSRAAKATSRSDSSRVAENRAKQVVARKPVAQSAPLYIPPLLLEDDPAPVSPPDHSATSEPAPPARSVVDEEVSVDRGLPRSYGTGKLFAIARDPRSLFVYWEVSEKQIQAHRRRSADPRMVLRIYRERAEGRLHVEVLLDPQVRSWYQPVSEGGAQYVAELGFYRRSDHAWVSLAVSVPVSTPPDQVSSDLSFSEITLSMDTEEPVPAEDGVAPVCESIPVRGREAMTAEPQVWEQFPGGGGPVIPESASAEEAEFHRVLTLVKQRVAGDASLELAVAEEERAFRDIRRELAPLQFPGGPVKAPSSIVFSLPSSGEAAGKPAEFPAGFWFNVNAELIVYGATESNAQVMIGGRSIPLRPDGSFTFRFALPDGRYQLPALAVSADGLDQRSADLSFSRDTQYRGDVGRHPQDERLRPPRVEELEV